MPTSNLLEGEWVLSTNVDSSPCRMEMPRDSWLSNSHSPISLPHKTYLDDEHLHVLKRRRPKSDTESDFLNSPKSQSAIHFKEFNQMSARDLMELEWAASIGVGSSSCWMEREKEKQLPYSHSPTSLPHKLCFGSKVRKLDYESLKSRTPSLSTDNSSFGFHIEERGSLLSNHVMELDEFGYHYPNKLCQREPDTLMLGWDSSSVTNERNFAIRCPNTPLSLYPVDNFDNRIRVLREPHLLPYHPTTPPSSWCSNSASHASDNLEEHHIEVKDDLVSFLNNSSLPSSPMTDHLDLAEHPNSDAMFEGTLSPQNHLWRISKFLNAEFTILANELFSPLDLILVLDRSIYQQMVPQEVYLHILLLNFPVTRAYPLPFFPNRRMRISWMVQVSEEFLIIYVKI